MRLKSFTARGVPEAMAKVRDALGADAVILSTQPDPGSGGVKITAALEEDSFAEDLAQFSDGLQAIDDLSETLDYHRIPPGLSDRLMAAAAGIATDDSGMALAAALDAECSFAPLSDRRTARPMMLAGLPGAGKTATAAKLCAWAKLCGIEPCLITMDLVKAGATAQAKTFSKALGTRLDQASDAEDLALIVDDCPADSLIVIDTIGANPFDPREQRRLAETARSVDAELILVLSAGGDTLESAEIALAFRQSGARTMIAAKTDASRRLGGILSAAHGGPLALIAAGTSPSIGDGLSSLNPVSLARLLLRDTADAAPALATGTHA